MPAAFGKYPAVERTREDSSFFTERKVETAVIPPNRLIKKGSGALTAVLTAAATDRAIGISVESNRPRLNATESGTWDSWPVGDMMLCCERNDQPVVIETDLSSVAEGAPITGDAAGKAIVAVATNPVSAVAIELITSRDGTKYVRAHPNFSQAVGVLP